MARNHARVNVAIWGSAEFRGLSPEAQHLYFVLVASPSLSYAGVADWRPKRLAGLSENWTVDQVERAGAELMEQRVVIIDEDTEEALVRTWIKHDGLIDQPRMAVSVANAYSETSSSILRAMIVHELRKLKGSQSNLKGWAQVKLLSVLEEPALDPKAEVNLPQTELPFGPNQTSPTPAPAPSPSPSSSSLLPATKSRTDPSDYPQAFEDFWNMYPKKADKRAALKAWEKATKRAGAGEIEAGAERYRDDPNREDQYTKNPATWLNADAWGNDPLPAKQSQQSLSFSEERNQRANQQYLDYQQQFVEGGDDPWSQGSTQWQISS